MLAAASEVAFLDRLQLVATSPLALVGYVVLVAAFVFRVWLGRQSQLIDLARGVAKKDLPAVVRWLTFGLPDELTAAHERLFRLRMQHTFWLAIVVALLVFAAVVGVSAMHVWSLPANEVDERLGRIETKIDELKDPAALATAIRNQISESATAKIAALPDQPGRGQEIAEIERQRDAQFGRVDDLVDLIQEGLKEGATEVFQRATEILEKEGVSAALDYLESRRASTLDVARRHAARAKTEKEERNRALEALCLEANLLETKLNWEPALELRKQVAQLAPDWLLAQTELGLLQFNLAHFRDAEPHLRAVAVLAANDKEQAAAFNNLAHLLLDTNRLAEAEPLMRRALEIDEQSYGPKHPDVATLLNNLALLLQATNRPAEAEPLMRRALAINEQSYGPEYPDVATKLNNLAQLLQDTNRLAEAEPLMRRALAINEQSYGLKHPRVARSLNNLAQLLKATNRLAEAEPLMRRTLAIDEHSYGPEHPDVAIALNNLALLLQATNRLAEAEPLMRRALAIDEQSYGPKHPRVAAELNNLAALLQATNRLAEAEPLMRRALAISEQSYGPEHPDVAIDLSNLAQLFQDTNRLAEAEPLTRRALAIVEQSYGPKHPKVAIGLNNLAQLLQATNRLAEAEPLMRRVVVIFRNFGGATGYEHQHMRGASQNYAVLLEEMKLPQDEREQYLRLASETMQPLEPMTPQLDRQLGPAKPVNVVLQTLDRQYKAEGRPDIYFLLPDQPMTPHLDELLGASKLAMPLDRPIAPHLDQLLGPARAVNEVLADLDRSYREKGRPAVWLLPLSEPIAPHLDELLGTADKQASD